MPPTPATTRSTGVSVGSRWNQPSSTSTEAITLNAQEQQHDTTKARNRP